MPKETATIPLSAFAKVHAARSAGHSLARALSWAEVAPEQWSAAEAAWNERLVESAAGDCSLLVAYDTHVLRVADLLAPRIEPLESDIVAWTQFSRHLAAAVDPDVFLAACGIQMADVMRLQRAWAGKRGADPSLATQALQAAHAPLEPVPALRVEPRVIGDDVRQGAVTPSQARPPADQRRTPVPPVFDPNSARAAHEVSAPPPLVKAIPVVAPAPPSLETTLTLTGSFVAADVHRRNPLPFDPAAPSAISRVEEKKQEPGDMRSGANKTTEFTEVDRLNEALREPVPFRRPAQGPQAAPRIVFSAEAHALPNKPPPAGAQNPAPAHRDPLESTVDLSTVLDPMRGEKPATPFERPGAGKPMPVPAAQPGSSTPPNTPTLTLERYASLCVELTAAPGHAQAVAWRYGLTHEQWKKVNAYWQGRMASEPDVRAAWERACVTYRDWLMRR
ncbi:hypothetical protein [Polyangium jinanense]|uniref:Uncharacterized protein n=1 Tax=Polyangium jinanense TaxID=2829994 RepID=A0A9X4ARK2_9BACT|nr:hypothetical protein [Polyangium jinanense]MDC3955581.1 hypothetical protein [Polyangium jinanense]MDC3982223.1 hypothetical protein [Polyangium jinanense]